MGQTSNHLYFSLKGKPKIELVDTPDCTSIDTSIPEDELLENRPVRQKAVDYDLGSIDHMALKEEEEEKYVVEAEEDAEDDIQDDHRSLQQDRGRLTLEFSNKDFQHCGCKISI